MSHVSSPVTILKDRAAMFKAVRLFFEERDVLEVDSPVLSKYPPIDAYIDILKTEPTTSQVGYFHSSPEYAMKKLLAQGIGDIFQLSHVFRHGENSPLHLVEFTMLEWYRKNISLSSLLHETKELIFLFLPSLPIEVIKYEDVFLHYFGISPYEKNSTFLQNLCQEHGFYSSSYSLESCLDFLMSLAEKSLGAQKLTFVTHFPVWQAALSKTFTEDQREYAGRFECYYQGIELANGYHELLDPIEQRRRLMIQNQKRALLGKEEYPIDEQLLDALEKLKHEEYCGVAVGFDRLMMLRHSAQAIDEVVISGAR